MADLGRPEEFSRFADLLPEPMLLVGGDAVVLAANPASAGLLGGMFGRELAGRRILELVDQDAQAVTQWLRACSRSRALLPGSLRFRGETGQALHCRADGAVHSPASGVEPATVLVRLTPRRKAANPFLGLNLRIEELTTEVGRRVRAEQALRGEREWFRVTLESIGDAVIATDSLGCITFMNSVAENLTGWSREDAMGRPLGEVFVIMNEYTREPSENPVDRVLRDGVTVALANHTILVRRDGTECSIDDSAAPIRDEDDEIAGVVLVFHEITERRKLERQLRMADQRKDEFLAMLAHELRNPLAPLRSGIEILRVGAGISDQAERIAEMMERQVQHMTRLVDDLLDVSRITRGSIELRRESVDLLPVLEHALEMVEQLNPSGEGAEVTLNLPQGPLLVDGDATRLSQVFVNLISNAVKFTEPGGRVTVTAGLEGARRDRIAVSVRDTGVGISEDDLSDIFELFVQTDRSLARTKGGLGLGLPVARRLTELHGGTLKARSEGPGRGSEFIVRLPGMLPAEGTDLEGTPSDEARDPGGAPGGRRVLVVDDNHDAAELLGMLVEHWGHEVALAHDGVEALQVAARFKPQLVLLDLGLPQLDGYEVAGRIRQDPELAGAVLIAVSGYGRREDRQRTQEAGFDDHLVKPVDHEVLKRLLGPPLD
ncbi:MAG: hybrid sensor histidine kinase/response regulator [Gemmatimonadales bacterium]|nr:MAG: hybrid sensor histidine kinase/response regulator [Gemmatimonadales bacterium]